MVRQTGTDSGSPHVQSPRQRHGYFRDHRRIERHHAGDRRMTPEQGTRVGLVPTSREFLDFALFKRSDGAGVPEYYATMLTQSTRAGGAVAGCGLYGRGGQHPSGPRPCRRATRPRSCHSICRTFSWPPSMVFASGYQMNFSAMARLTPNKERVIGKATSRRA